MTNRDKCSPYLDRLLLEPHAIPRSVSCLVIPETCFWIGSVRRASQVVSGKQWNDFLVLSSLFASIVTNLYTECLLMGLIAFSCASVRYSLELYSSSNQQENVRVWHCLVSAHGGRVTSLLTIGEYVRLLQFD
jgi:hypothetical protein